MIDLKSRNKLTDKLTKELNKKPFMVTDDYYTILSAQIVLKHFFKRFLRKFIGIFIK